MERWFPAALTLCMYVWVYRQRPGYLLLRLAEEDHTTHVNTNYVVKSDDGAYLYLR